MGCGKSSDKAGQPTGSEDRLVSKILDIKKSNPDNIMAQAFTKEYYDSLSAELQQRLLACCQSGIENPDSQMGCYACQPSDYDELSTFFNKALELYHKVNLSERKHINDWSLEGKPGLPESGVLDLAEFGIPELSMRVRTGRNLNKYPLPAKMTKEDRVNLELDMKPVFDKLIANPDFGGKYNSITPEHENFIDKNQYQELVDRHIMFKDMSADSFLVTAGIAGDWPSGRGCYVSEDAEFIIWVGEEDHLRIMAMQKGTILNKVFDRLKSAIDVIEDLIPKGCAKGKDIGVVTSCPTNAGTGMRASVHIKLPNLTKDGTEDKAKQLLKPLGLSVRGLGGEHTAIGKDGTVDISPSARFCITEAEIVIALYNGLKKVQEEEQNAA